MESCTVQEVNRLDWLCEAHRHWSQLLEPAPGKKQDWAEEQGLTHKKWEKAGSWTMSQQHQDIRFVSAVWVTHSPIQTRLALQELHQNG